MTKWNCILGSKKMRTYILAAFLFVASTLVVTGCSLRYQDLPVFASWPIYNAENNSVGRFKTSYLTDQINAYFKGNTAGPIAVTTFSDIDNLSNSSSFGRILGEQVMSELVMHGYNVIELRRSDSFQVQEGEGEFALSREIERIKQSHNLAGIVVGTYAASTERVYLNARIIDPATSMVIAVGSVEMEKTQEIAKLLRSNSWPTSMERIPVRPLGNTGHNLPYYWPYANGMLEEQTTSKGTKDREPAKIKKSLLEAPTPKLEPLS